MRVKLKRLISQLSPAGEDPVYILGSKTVPHSHVPHGEGHWVSLQTRLCHLRTLCVRLYIYIMIPYSGKSAKE
jgi:hypothetical protein